MISTSGLLLSEDEVRRLTGREKPTFQAKVLHELGIPFKTHPIDCNLLVSRSAAERALGGDVPAPGHETGQSRQEFTVDVDAIRRYGKKAASH